jgi:hypothetical protein
VDKLGIVQFFLSILVFHVEYRFPILRTHSVIILYIRYDLGRQLP